MNRTAVWVGGAILAMALALVFAVSRLSHRAHGAITGRVWVTTTSGESFDQRGLPVFLLRETVDSRQLGQAAQRVADEIKRRASGASDHSGIMDDAESLQAKIASLEGRIPVRDAIALVNAPPFNRYGTIGIDDFYVSAMRTTVTNAAGEYEFRGVEPGVYVVSTKTPAGVVSNDVRVNGNNVIADLH